MRHGGRCGSKLPAGPIAYPIRFDFANRGMARLLLLVRFSAAALFTAAVAVLADDKKDSAKPAEPETVVCLELPHPERADRPLDRPANPGVPEALCRSTRSSRAASSLPSCAASRG